MAGGVVGLFLPPHPLTHQQTKPDQTRPRNKKPKTTTRWKRKSFVTAGKTWLVVSCGSGGHVIYFSWVGTVVMRSGVDRVAFLAVRILGTGIVG